MPKLSTLLLAAGLSRLFTVNSLRTSCTRPDTTEIQYRGDGGDNDLPEIYKALATCPNITTLDLDLVWGGCVAPEQPWAFDFQPGDRFPALSKLSLSRYDLADSWRQSQFYQSRWTLKEKMSFAWKHVPQFFSNVWEGKYNEPVWVRLPAPEETNLDKWLRVMDFSKIEELHLAQEDKVFYERMKDELPSLRRASFEWSNSGAQVPDERVEFIRNIPPLESLSIDIGAPYSYAEGIKNRTQFPLATILENHGASLRSLSLKQGEGHEPHLRRPMLSLDELKSIGESCPKLNQLELDIDRDASYGWPNWTFDALSQIPSLESLKLRLEIGADLHSNDPGDYYWNPGGIDGPGPFREPRMSLEVAESLFDDLRASKKGKALEKVEFVVGDFEAKPYSGPIYLPPWEEGRGRSFVCQLNDDGERNCTLYGHVDSVTEEFEVN